MIAATAYSIEGEEVVGPVIDGQVLVWHGSDPVMHDVAAILDEQPCTNLVHTYRRLARWLSTRSLTVWGHLLDAFCRIGDALVPIGPPPPTGPPQPSAPRPRAAVRPSWFVD